MNVLIHFCRKIYRVTATINCNAKTLVDKWIKSGDDFCSWNKTLLEFKILKKISDSVALTYQVRPTVNCHVPGQIQTEEVYHSVYFSGYNGRWAWGYCRVQRFRAGLKRNLERRHLGAR